ncbi:MAG: hypothetical protein EU539_06325 [Promethearchaeota archaeon]|nr:MAG: hypothetical protein EU539_06325 [Candidatus Lokiarchaeota archaeon]
MQEIFVQNLPTKKEIEAFLNNYQDLSYHDEIISRATEIAKKVPQVDALFLLGSLAIKSGDVFSDIDFYVMYENEDVKEEIRTAFMKEINKLGEIIHVSKSSANPNDVIIFFKPYVKFELAFRSFNVMKNKWKVAESAQLLYDRTGLGKKAMDHAKQLIFNFNKYDKEIRNVAIALPSFCYIIAGYMTRGEYVTSIDFVAWIRRLLLRVSGFLLGMRDEGTRKAEQRFPKELIKFYHESMVSDIKDIWNALDVFFKWYVSWLVPKFEEHDISHANQEVKIIKHALMKIKNSWNKSNE